jgi:hypothetical protein
MARRPGYVPEEQIGPIGLIRPIGPMWIDSNEAWGTANRPQCVRWLPS